MTKRGSPARDVVRRSTAPKTTSEIIREEEKMNSWKICKICGRKVSGRNFCLVHGYLAPFEVHLDDVRYPNDNLLLDDESIQSDEAQLTLAEATNANKRGLKNE